MKIIITITLIVLGTFTIKAQSLKMVSEDAQGKVSTIILPAKGVLQYTKSTQLLEMYIVSEVGDKRVYAATIIDKDMYKKDGYYEVTFYGSINRSPTTLIMWPDETYKIIAKDSKAGIITFTGSIEFRPQ